MTEYKNKGEIKKEHKQKTEFFKKIKKNALWIVALGVVGYGVFWIVTLPKIPQSELVSSTGIHWHPNISITIKGEEVNIPSGIGIGAVHNPMHTHEADGTVHMEYSGVVRESDTLLGNFFKVWGKDFSKDSILGNTNGEEGVVTMTVNGVKNLEFENYTMKDGDMIKIIFE